jgi:hypothetical protein
MWFAMLRNKHYFLWSLAGLVIAAAAWALDVEITYEHNMRRGIPANFQFQNPHRATQWRI